MNTELGKQIVTHFNSLKEEREPWQSAVEEALKYIVPNKYKMTVDTSVRGYTPDTTAKDGTARSSAYLMANGLLGNVCSQRSKWFKLTPELPEQQEQIVFSRWFEQVENVFYHMFSTGGFYAAAWQVFSDAALSGLGTMYIGENKKEKTIDFLTYAPKGIYIATDQRNKIDTLFHYFTLTARDIVDEYEDLPDDFKRNAKNKPFQRFKIIHAVFPRKDRDVYKIDSINKPFASVHVLEQSSYVLRESGYDSFPYAVFRYSYDSEEVYPHSPSLDGVADIRRLTNISKDVTDVSQLNAKPPHIVPSEMYNDFELKPNFKLKAYDMSRVPQALNIGQNYPIGKDREEYYRQIVKEHYFTNVFLMLAASEGTQMTATEVLERQGEKSTVIGAMVSRLLKEFLDPMFDRMFMIAAKNRWIPDPPTGLENVSIDYLGPLAQAQQRYLKLQSPMASLQNFLPLIEAYPELRDVLKPYDLGKQILVGGGMPSTIINERDVFNQIQQQKQEQMAQQQQTEMMKEQAEAMNKGAKAPEPGSPTEMLMEQQNG